MALSLTSTMPAKLMPVTLVLVMPTRHLVTSPKYGKLKRALSRVPTPVIVMPAVGTLAMGSENVTMTSVAMPPDNADAQPKRS